ncbi:MAG: hypothetical protein GY909_18035 [Oligoflexia bacterium]|nr:hypothetical protein [Oligoflexia bacterium]
MKDLTRKILLIFVLTVMTMNAFATVKYGTSSGYNPNWDTKTMFKHLDKKREEIKKRKKELKKELRKAKGKKAKDAVRKKLKENSAEFDKVYDDYQFERKLQTDPRKPKKKAQAEAWKRKERQKRIDKLKAKQKKHEEKLKKQRSRAVSMSDLNDLGDVTIGEISSANTDVTNAQRDLNDIEDEIQEESCDVITDENIEICMELRNARTQASARLEESKLRFRDLAIALPPVLVGGGLYVIYDRMTDLQERYDLMRGVKRELIGCEENCELIEDRVELIKNGLEEQQQLDKYDLDEMQDELKKEEAGELDAELVIPNYLAKNTQIPFGNKGELPIIFAVDKAQEVETVRSANALVNGQFVELVYYPERGVFTGSYTSFESKQDLSGMVQVELVDGQTLTKSFTGRINNEKPNVEIHSVPGSLFKKGKFKVHVTGEFDKIEISGENVKPQTIEFEEMKSSHKMTIKAMSKGPASINVVATRTSKTISMPDFDGDVLVTDEVGRLLRNDDFFKEMDLGDSKGKELGWCCEEVGEITCVACYKGKRTRASCKALNKLPGYDIKAFLSAKDMSCTAL